MILIAVASSFALAVCTVLCSVVLWSILRNRVHGSTGCKSCKTKILVWTERSGAAVLHYSKTLYYYGCM